MKNKNSLLKFEIISTIFTLVLGTLLHFTFEWFNNNPIIGIFSAVNESTWEHLKLVFFPMLITTIVGYFYFKNKYPNYLCNKTKGILIAMAFIVIFFYTYNGIIGKNVDILNITSFIIGVILGEYIAYKNIKKQKQCHPLLAGITLLILFICFSIFTFYTPQIGLFKDPVTKTYGIVE